MNTAKWLFTHIPIKINKSDYKAQFLAQSGLFSMDSITNYYERKLICFFGFLNYSGRSYLDEIFEDAKFWVKDGQTSSWGGVGSARQLPPAP